MSLRDRFLDTYGRLLGWPALYRAHVFLLDVALRGVGVLNYRNMRATGEFSFLQSLLGGLERPLVLDVGAHRGGYAETVLGLAPQAHVVAFEPHPESFPKLEIAARRFGFTAVHAACSDVNGTAQLFDYAGREGSSHASLHRGAIASLRGAATVPHSVTTLRLDDYCREQGIGRIDLLKIDTEGNELAVLRGAERLLRAGAIDRVQLEFTEINALNRIFLADIAAALPGYDLYRMLPHGLAPLGAYAPRLHEIFAYQNLVAVRTGLDAKGAR